MKGDPIILSNEFLEFGAHLAERLLPQIRKTARRYAIAVAGESGSGKSTTTLALARSLEDQGIVCTVLQQDDYYVYPPKTNDRRRRKDSNWHGIREVHLELLDQHIQQILDGGSKLEKPLSIYEDDRFDTEKISIKNTQVVIAEGSYVTLLKNVHTRIFIERTYLDTRVYRQQRAIYKAELDEFTENILMIEHEIISNHKPHADIIITKEYRIQANSPL